jgi:Tfp pilus assembly protein PilV
VSSERASRVDAFTLVEVVVALVVLQVGILAALGVLVLAARTMTRAQTLERVVWRASALRDSLEAVDGVTEGRDSTAAVRAWWVPSGTGFTLTVEGEGVVPFRVSGARAWP